MLLAIDIGNTTISIGIIKLRRVVSIEQIQTTSKSEVLRKNLRQKLFSLVKRYPFERAIICSVVPKAVRLVRTILVKELKLPTRQIGLDLCVPIKNLYRNPRQVGQDRLVCAYAAREFYGSPLIVIDFGTAITFDVVSKKGEYSGGIIVPGIRLTAEALFNKTALLPKVTIKIPRELIGRDTKNSILSGIFFGYGALCNGLIDLIARQMKTHPRVILTGGYGHLMRKFISRPITRLDNELIFRGIELIDRNDRF